MTVQSDIHVKQDGAALTQYAATQIVQLATSAIAERGVFRFCVAGGQTPRSVYAQLAAPQLAAKLDFSRMQLYFGDERCVSPEDAQSNYRMLRESLLSHVRISPQQVHRIPGELQPQAAAQTYQAELQRVLGVSADGSPEHVFDLVLLGLGADVHTASLFPGSNVISDPSHWVSARQHPDTGQWRVTLTEPLLNSARCAAFLISGADKAAALAAVLEAPRDPVQLPGQRIAPAGTLQFWVDAAAASALVKSHAPPPDLTEPN